MICGHEAAPFLHMVISPFFLDLELVTNLVMALDR
jgi:hypothetical protein